jgi:DNA-directed RNA polymerase I, II, and III subunit RPABC5
MIIPVQCFTCGKQVGHLWETYQQKLQEEYNKKEGLLKVHILTEDVVDYIKKNKSIEEKTLDELGLKRYCCRRMMISHVDLCEKL